MFQNITQIVKTSYSFNDFKQRNTRTVQRNMRTVGDLSYVSPKDAKISLKDNNGIILHHGDFYCLNCLHSLAAEKKT